MIIVITAAMADIFAAHYNMPSGIQDERRAGADRQVAGKRAGAAESSAWPHHDVCGREPASQVHDTNMIILGAVFEAAGVGVGIWRLMAR